MADNMITTKEVKIKIPNDFTSEYIESNLSIMGYDVLKWAITGYDEEYYTLNISVVI